MITTRLVLLMLYHLQSLVHDIVCVPKKVNRDHQFHSGQSLEEGA